MICDHSLLRQASRAVELAGAIAAQIALPVRTKVCPVVENRLASVQIRILRTPYLRVSDCRYRKSGARPEYIQNP